MASVMVVEDENIVARDIAETLKLFGYQVAGVAATGQDAIDEALRQRPDLVLMDIHLRGAMDGIAAAASIREQLDVPIIFLSADADMNSIARAKLTEPYGFLVKPYNDKELRSVVEVALYKHGVERQIRNRERLFSLTLSSIGDAVITTDEANRVSFVNPVAESLTGWKASEAEGHDVSEVVQLVREDGGAPVECPAVEALRDRDVVGLGGGPTELVSRAGKHVSIDDSAAAIIDSAGKLLGAVLVFRDVSEHRKLVRLQAAVAELGQRALRSGWFGDVLRDAVALVARALDVEFCGVFELLPVLGAQRLSWGVGWKEGSVGVATVPNDFGSQGRFTLLSEAPVIVEHLPADARFRASPLLHEHGIESGVSVAITSGEGPFGVLGVYAPQARVFNQDAVNFVQTVATMLGIVIERRRGEERLLRSNRSHRALSRCNDALVRATSEVALLAQICRSIVEGAGYPFCWVGRKEDDDVKSVTPIAHAGVDDGYMATLNISWSDTACELGPTGTCLRTAETQVTNDVAVDPRFARWREEAMKRGYASVIAIPLVVDAALFGTLTIYATEKEAFGREQQLLLSELAANLGYGIGALHSRAEIRALNAELEQRVAARTFDLQTANLAKDELIVREQSFTKEIRQARQREIDIGFKIQQMLLLGQPPHEVQGWLLGASTVPSRWIAGDFYEFFRHENQCIDLIVADVMGKGVPAALLGAATKSHFLGALCHLMALATPGRLPEPQEIVTLAHAQMVRQLLDLESFVTLCYARFDLRTHRLELVDCGHTGTLHWRAKTRDCGILHGDNLPLGVREGAIYSQITLAFESSDLFVFYSDGITEARNSAGELFGVTRLVDCVKRHADLHPEALIGEIREAVLAFSEPSPLADDLTCVAMKASSEADVMLARAELEIRSHLGELHRGREFVRAFCLRLPHTALSVDACNALELAVTEATSNIMKHAAGGHTDQRIQLEAERYKSHVSIRLHYLGDAFDPTRVPPPVFDGSRDSGFGVYMIAESVDEVRYYRDERGRNCVVLRKLCG